MAVEAQRGVIDTRLCGYSIVSTVTEKAADMPIGPFCRWESETQTRQDALMQEKSGEVWGRAPRGGLEPTVQAYIGPLKNRRGIEFITNTAPHPNASPFEARWYLTRTPGVVLRQKGGEDFACILARVKNMQP
jgi:hypothetical protein